MAFEHVRLTVFGAVAIVNVVLAASIVWLFHGEREREERMVRSRSGISPPLSGEGIMLVDDILEHLRAWDADTRETIESLRVARRGVEEHARQFESPDAAFEYIDFFTEVFTGAAADLERVVAELPQGVQAAHVDMLRQIASNAAAEQRRCLLFRDKWISRPLPYEQIRPLLSEIAADTRDQLEDYSELKNAASRLEELVAPGARPREEGRSLDRRALFTRWFGR